MSTFEITENSLVCESWRPHIKAFIYDNFDLPDDPITLDAWQDEAVTYAGNLDLDRLYLSLQACAGPGKTAVLAWISWWWIACMHTTHHFPKGCAVAESWENLQSNLWPEMSKWQKRSPFLSHFFTWTAKRIYCNEAPEDWWFKARAWPKTADATARGRTLSGLHSKFPWAVVDESGDIPVEVKKAGEQMHSTAWRSMLAQAGNPTSQEGMLHAAQGVEAGRWKVIRITGDPNDPNRSTRVDAEWAQEMIDLYGRDDPWVGSYILGKFPEHPFNQLLTYEQVYAAMDRTCKPGEFMPWNVALGIDVAREGLDRSVLTARQGPLMYVPKVLPSTILGPEGAGHTARLVHERNVHTVFIDGGGGFAGSWVDHLRPLGIDPIEVNFSKPASNPRYANRRAEMAFEMADWVKRVGCIPKDAICHNLVAELVEPRYTFVRDAMLIEDKRQVKARLKRSPDMSDSLMLTFAAPMGMPTSRFEAEYGGGGGYGEGNYLQAECDPDPWNDEF